jgi:hypothetical protein
MGSTNSYPTPVTIDGVPATMFFGSNSIMGDTREIWFIHGGFLYEVTTYKQLDSWLTPIMQTWQFTPNVPHPRIRSIRFPSPGAAVHSIPTHAIEPATHAPLGLLAPRSMTIWSTDLCGPSSVSLATAWNNNVSTSFR